MSELITLPDFQLDSSAGALHLNQQQGWLILYFYPKDATPGCTTQANEFTALKDEFTQLGVRIVGVSRDSISSHARFIEKQGINFTLISDPDERLCKHFDVIKEKNMYGKTVLGIQRSTFIVSGGKLVKSYRKVKAAGHAQQVLADIKLLQQTT